MFRVLMSFTAALILPLAPLSAQQLAPAPTAVKMTQLKNAGAYDGQVVQVDSVVVRHADTSQVFTFGDKQGPEMHVLIPSPALDAAHIGDSVTVVGTVRKYSASDFERDYQWFRKADYPDLGSGTWVIVAKSVRTPDGSDLVPPGKVSEMPKK